MQTASRMIWIYAFIVLIGGMIGYFTAHSLPSLIASSITAFLLVGCGYFIQKEQNWAYYAAMAIAGALLVFFGYRFSLSYQWMPGGLMTILTACLLTYLLMKLKNCCCCRKVQ